jgi:hypothetical protein
MSRRQNLLLAVLAVIVIACVGFAVFNHAISIAFHQWRMEAAYGSLFGNPEPIGNGLAAFDVSAKDVDAAIANYESHREALVRLNALAHLTASFPELASDGTEDRSEKRSEFVHRMWRVFPGHRHYWLRPDGTFETWVPVTNTKQWKTFLDSEIQTVGSNPENHVE